MKIAIFFTFTIIHLATAFNISAGDCKTDWDKGGPNLIRPLLFLDSEFVYPEYSSLFPPGKILINNGEEVDLICYDGNIIDQYTQKSLGTAATAKCEDGKFKIGPNAYDLFHLQCTLQPKHTAKVIQPLSFYCAEIYQEIGIGYVFSANEILPQIIICFDQKAQLTTSSTFTLTKSIAQHDKSVPAKSFIKGGFFKDINMDMLYNKQQQMQTINTLFHYNYIIDDAKHYLACGHLSAKADFVYAIQQDATYYYLNGVPQWQMINNGNWKQVEEQVREFAIVAQKDLSITTGTHGVATLRENGNLNGASHPLKLSYGGKEIPVPALIWKLVYDPQLKQAIVIISVNNPYFIFVKEILCMDMLPSLYWLKLKDSKDPKKGYIYACKYQDAKAKIPELPDIHVTGLLL